ncbi:unnamed protein product [Parajaminaea phylloscopi]
MPSLLRRLSQRSRASAESHTSAGAVAVSGGEEGPGGQPSPVKASPISRRFSLHGLTLRTRSASSVKGPTGPSVGGDIVAVEQPRTHQPQPVTTPKRNPFVSREGQWGTVEFGRTGGPDSLTILPLQLPPESPRPPVKLARSRSGTSLTDIKAKLLSIAARRYSGKQSHRTDRCDLLEDAEHEDGAGRLAAVEEILTECHGSDYSGTLLKHPHQGRGHHRRHRSLEAPCRDLDAEPGERLFTRADLPRTSQSLYFQPDLWPSLDRHHTDSPVSEKSLYECFGSRPLKLKSDGQLRLEHGLCTAHDDDDEADFAYRRLRQRRASDSEMEVVSTADAGLGRSSSRPALQRSCTSYKCSGASVTQSHQRLRGGPDGADDDGTLVTSQPQTAPPLFMSDLWTRQRMSALPPSGDRQFANLYSSFPNWRPQWTRTSNDPTATAASSTARQTSLKGKSARRSVAPDGFSWSLGQDNPLTATQLALPPRASTPIFTEVGARRPRSALFPASWRSVSAREGGSSEVRAPHLLSLPPRRPASACSSRVLDNSLDTSKTGDCAVDVTVPASSPSRMAAVIMLTGRARSVTDPALPFAPPERQRSRRVPPVPQPSGEDIFSSGHSREVRPMSSRHTLGSQSRSSARRSESLPSFGDTVIVVPSSRASSRASHRCHSPRHLLPSASAASVQSTPPRQTMPIC